MRNKEAKNGRVRLAHNPPARPLNLVPTVEVSHVRFFNGALYMRRRRGVYRKATFLANLIFANAE